MRASQSPGLRPEFDMSSPLEKKFWSKVDVVIIDPDACWQWRGTIGTGGYGTFRFRGQTYRAHRLAWQISNGAIPEGLHILHKCVRNRSCVNSAHLYAGTPKDNMADMTRQRTAHIVSDWEATVIRELYAKGEHSQLAIAHLHGISSLLVNRIVKEAY